MAVSKRVRYEVLRRDGHACRYCGAMAPEVKLTIDHVIPVALGGSDDPSNLLTACVDCNAGKTSTAPDQALVVEADAKARVWADAMKRAGEMLAAVPAPQQDYLDAFAVGWDKWRTNGGQGDPIPTPGGWEDTLVDFYLAGLPTELMLKAVDLAMTAYGVKDEFSYFVGICRRMLREQHAVAQALLERGDA